MEHGHQVYVDPQTGRRYSVNPITGQAEWVDVRQPPPAPRGIPVGYAGPVDPFPLGTYAQGPQRKRGRAALKVAGGIVGGLLTIGVVGTALESGDTTTTTTAGSNAKAAPSAAKAKAATKAAAPDPAPAPKKPIVYKPVNARTWKLIAKDPDNYKGQAIIIYGYVTQFDSATGTDTFRANVDGIKHAEYYDYDTNTVLTGTERALADLVADDIFLAKVIVDGSLSYETAMGGETTVPRLRVDSLKVIGSTS